METIENLEFDFIPEKLQIQEGADWLSIGGVALTEGKSRNNNFYSQENLKENDGKEFKWLVGHPLEEENHVVGLGKLKIEEGVLRHEGKIRNTANHPDIIDSVRDGFLGPSIHASAKKVTRKEGAFHVEGLDIEGVGLVAFQGVKSASIDFALAESFDKRMADLIESPIQEDEDNKDNEGDIMTEEEKVEEPAVEVPKEEVDVPAPAEEVEVAKEESVSLAEFNKVRAKMEAMEKQLKEADNSNAIVETLDEKPKDGIEEKDGSLALGRKAWEKFNEELRERVR